MDACPWSQDPDLFIFVSDGDPILLYHPAIPVGKSCFSLIDWLANPYIPPVYHGELAPTVLTPFAYGLDPVIAFRFEAPPVKVGEKLTNLVGETISVSIAP